MMVPPGAVARLENQRLNLNEPRPAARRKREVVYPSCSRVLKAECKRGARQYDGEAGCEAYLFCALLSSILSLEWC